MKRKCGGFGLCFRLSAQHSMELDTVCSRWTSILVGPSNTEYSMILRITPSILATQSNRNHIFRVFYPKPLRSQKSHRFQRVSTLILQMLAALWAAINIRKTVFKQSDSQMKRSCRPSAPPFLFNVCANYALKSTRLSQ